MRFLQTLRLSWRKIIHLLIVVVNLDSKFALAPLLLWDESKNDNKKERMRKNVKK